MNNTRQIKIFIGGIMAAAFAAAGYASFTSHTPHSLFALAVLGLAASTSRMKVKLPGVNGNMSVNLPFLLTAAVNLSAVEAILITVISTTVQCWPRKGTRFNPQQMSFNLSMMVFATASASLMFHAAWLTRLEWSANPVGLALATLVLFLGQTGPVAGIVSVSDNKSLSETWRSLALLSFPYYVISAGITSMVQAVSAHLGWELALAVFPVMYFVHRSYKLYFNGIAVTMRSEMLVKAAGAGA